MSVLPVGIAASGDEAYTLDNSLRIRQSASAYLSRDFPTAGDRRTHTYSVWVKRGTISTTQYLFGGGYSFSGGQSGLYFTATNNELLFRYNTGVTSLRTSQYFRDVSAWYHIVAVMDSTQSTASERMRLYINGERVTSLSVANYPAQNTESLTNTASIHVIGNESYTGYRFPFDGYMTEINFIDGQALTADDFGEFDATTGVWKPKAYSGTYGTNGFYLPTTATTQAEGFNTVLFTGTSQDNQTISDVGFQPDLVWLKSRSNAQNHYLIDSVRGGNSFLYSNATSAENTTRSWITEFTSDGFTVTDQVISNGYTYAAWTWDAGDNQTSTGISSVAYTGNGVSMKVSGFGFSPDLVWIKNRDAAQHHNLFDSVRGSGKLLYPNLTNAEATSSTHLNSFDSDGFTVGSATSANGAGNECIAWGWDAGDGDPVSNTTGDINSTVKANDATGFSIVSYTGDGNTGGVGSTVGHGLSTAPKVIIYKNRDSSTLNWMVTTTAIDGSVDFSFLNNTLGKFDSTENAPTSSVFSAAYAHNNTSGNDIIAYCFSEVSGISEFGSYQGNGSASGPSVTTGFRPGFLLIKGLDVTGGASWLMVDGTRNPFNPVDASLYADDSAAEGAANRVNFTDTGFEVITTSTLVNENTKNYLYMAFKGSYSDYVSPLNTDGDIDSRVKANTEKGFSVVNWTGSGVADDRVGHGLNSAPELILYKDRNGTGRWYVWTTAIDGSDDYLFLDGTNAANNISSIYTSPTSTTISNFGYGAAPMLAYCWHSVAGYSSFGSYTGTGTSGNSVTGLGFKPAWIMYKRTDTTSNWTIHDITRDPSNEGTKRLYPNLTNAEQTVTGDITFDSDGFTLDGTGGDSNASGGTYIYMAFADTRDAQFNFDASGNKNNWTPNNINSNASSEPSYDIMTDVPTLTDEYTANYATLSPLTLNAGGGAGSSSDGNLKWIGTGGNDNVFGTMAASSGKWYYEIEIVANPTTLVAGWSTTDELADYTQSALVYYNSAGIRNGNRTVVWNTNVTTGLTFSVSDVIGFALDIDSGDLKVYQNNSLVSTITLPTDKGDKWIPAFGDSSATDASFTVNFGQQPFTYTPPTGFLPLNTYNLPDSTIVDGSEYMNTVLYTGDNVNPRTISTGLSPDLTWIKTRSVAQNHALYDVLRGDDLALRSNTTDVESQYGTVELALENGGFTTDVPSGTNSLNYLGRTYAAWNWKANGSGVSNTVGDTNATVSANTTSGFSIVSFNAGAAGNHTVGHGLGVTPEFIVYKDRDSSGYGNWVVFHSAVCTSTSNYLLLNGTGALGSVANSWGSALPTSTVFGFGSNVNVAANDDIIAYCFAAVEGFSSFGSYAGNGSTDGPFIYTGFRPAWIMVKRTNSADNWWMQDNARDPYNVAKHYLSANTTNAEFSNLDVYDYTANGFKIRTTTTAVNASGSTYIYAAFAENPFKNSLAR